VSAVAVKTDTNSCAVCRHPKAERWHLVCTSCWSNVPSDDQRAIIDLNRRESGSNRHRMHCRKVVRALCERKRGLGR
jgi:hypothetical protein